MEIQTVLHIESRTPVVAPPARETVSVRRRMFLVNEDSSNPARATTEVFVRTPRREIDTPFVKV